MLRTMRSFLKENDMMAYLAMMAVGLIELHRVLKPTGSLYLHCDPTASHYLKILLDAVFGTAKFRNEVIWDYSFRLMDLPKFFNRKHDVILFYAKSHHNVFRMPKTEWTREDIIRTRKQEIHVDENGVEWIWMPGGKGNSKNKLKKIEEIIKEGKAVSDVWQIPTISSSSKERLGYPTQKPLALLEPPQRRGERTHVHGLRGDVEEMRKQAADLGIEHADELGALRDGDADELLYRERKGVLLVHRRHVVEAVEIRQRLEIGLVLNQLLGAAVEKPDMRIDALDDLAVELEHKAQHAMRGRMLRPEIDGEFAVATVPLAGLGLGILSAGFDVSHQASTLAFAFAALGLLNHSQATMRVKIITPRSST
jgi:hypothetical protein